MSQTPIPPNGGTAPGMPGWVKILAIIFIVLILAFVTLHLTGGVPWGHQMP